MADKMYARAEAHLKPRVPEPHLQQPFVHDYLDAAARAGFAVLPKRDPLLSVAPNDTMWVRHPKR